MNMRWYDCLDALDFEMALLKSFYVYCTYLNGCKRSGTYAELAFYEFKHMWE